MDDNEGDWERKPTSWISELVVFISMPYCLSDEFTELRTYC